MKVLLNSARQFCILSFKANLLFPFKPHFTQTLYSTFAKHSNIPKSYLASTTNHSIISEVINTVFSLVGSRKKNAVYIVLMLEIPESQVTYEQIILFFQSDKTNYLPLILGDIIDCKNKKN